jgi:hypothetical protein
MSSIISTSDIRNVHIYKEKNRSHELDLCRRHQRELCESISNKINKLVTTKLFQSQFKDFFPAANSDEGIHVKIRITTDSIILRKIDKDGHVLGNSQKINFNQLDDLETEGIEEAAHLNQSILKKANRIYQDHLRENRDHGQSPSPLRGRSLHREDNSRRDRSAFSESPYRSRRDESRHPRSPEIKDLDDDSDDQLDGRRPAHHDRSESPPLRRRHSHFESRNDRSPERDFHRESDPHIHRRRRSESPSPRRHSHFESLHLESDYHVEKRSRSDLPPSRRQSHHDGRRARPPLSTDLTPEELIRRRTHEIELERKLREVSIENESLKGRLAPPTCSVLSADFDKLIDLSNTLSSQFSTSIHFQSDLKEEFMTLPEAIRNAIYYQTYLLVDPAQANDPWPIGKKLFEGNSVPTNSMRQDIRAENLCRAHAIRHFLLHSLASDFAQIGGKTPSPELLNRFNQLPEEDKEAVYIQLEYVLPGSSRNPVRAFAGVDRLDATNQERSIAIHRVTLDRIAEYHRHHSREQINAIERVFQEAYAKLQKETAAEIKSLR